MNKQRRKELYALIRELGRVKNNEGLDDCINTLENLKYEEESYYNNAPENLQYSRRYELSEGAIEKMEDALGYLNEAVECEDENEFQTYIKDAISAVESAIV